MRGTSAASLQSLLNVAEAQKTSEQLGDDLFNVVASIDSTPALRRVLTDPSVESNAKEQLVADVFGAHLSPAALAVVKDAVAGRWSAAGDLADALEIAGVRTYVATAGEEGSETIQNELFAFGQVIAENAELRDALTNRNYPATGKASLVRGVLGNKASAASVALAAQAVAARRANVNRTLAQFATIAADYRSRLVADVRVAFDLTESERTRLSAALAKKYGRAVHLNIAVDPEVVGGITVAIGDQTIDGSIASKLEDAKRRIAG